MTEIRIYPAEGTWVVRAEGAVIAETRAAMEVIEGDAPFVIYFPREDVAMAFLEGAARQSACDHRGAATHYHITSPGGTLEDAALSYEAAPETFAAIRGYLAFDAGKVTVERV
ncbi:MAG: DUF427 domain-containing protein [Rhodobacteraceae bacterium]|nr:DUF427 domain-containing protein [Paracoccaceae bacterium]